MAAPPSSSMPSFDVVARSGDWWMATWDDTVVSRWGRDTNEMQLRRNQALVLEHSRRYPAGVCTVGLIDVLGAHVDPGVRQAATQLIKSTDPVTRCRATVVNGQGFWLSALRGILLGVGFFQGVPSGIFSDVDEALEFLAKEANKAPHWCAALRRAIAAETGEPAPPSFQRPA